MKEAKVEYDDIADMHWWMVDHIHYLPAMIYAVLLIDKYQSLSSSDIARDWGKTRYWND